MAGAYGTATAYCMLHVMLGAREIIPDILSLLVTQDLVAPA